jgi:hypothetical protein
VTTWAERVRHGASQRNVARIRPGSSPRFEIWHALTGGGKPEGFQPWIDARWEEYEQDCGLDAGKAATFVHQEPFDRWPTEYAKRRGAEVVEPIRDPRQTQITFGR